MKIHRLMTLLLRVCLIGSLLIVVSYPREAIANTYTYLYTGFPFSVWFDSGCPPECSLTGSMTFAQPLPSDLPWTTPLLAVDTLLAYSFTDGVNSYTQSNSVFKQLYGSVFCGDTPCVSTGSGGAIKFWSIALLNNAGVQLLSEGYPTQNGPAGQDSIIVDTQFGLELQAGSSAYGTWTGPFENTPEPSSLLLSCTGLVSLSIRFLARRVSR